MLYVQRTWFLLLLPNMNNHAKKRSEMVLNWLKHFSDPKTLTAKCMNSAAESNETNILYPMYVQDTRSLI